MPISQTGRRARRKTSQTSKAAVLSLLAPRRWHTEAVAVQKLAAMASRSAFSISPAPRPWPPRSPPAPQQAAILSWSQPSGVHVHANRVRVRSATSSIRLCCARSGQATFRAPRAAARRALRNRRRRRSPRPSDLGHQSSDSPRLSGAERLAAGPSALARGCPPPPPCNRSGPGTPGRPGDTGAARLTSGPATPAPRSSHANDHPVPPRHQHSSGNWTLQRC
jgi:hypothetical protein